MNPPDPIDAILFRREEEERDQQTREGMANVKAGRVIDHQAIQARADGLDSDNQDAAENFSR